MAEVNVKVKVTLRKIASIKGDRQLLYLDFWPPITVKGKQTRREWLHLYLFEKEIIKDGKKTGKYIQSRNPFERDHNIKVQDAAKKIKLRRENELDKPEIYNPFEIEQLKKMEIGEGSFTDFLKDYVIKNQRSKHDIPVLFEKHLLIFSKDKKLKFADITEKFCNGFRDYLLTAKNIKNHRPIARNTANLYFTKFKTVLKLASKAGNIPSLNDKLGSIGTTETRRNYLTIDELNSLVIAPCTDPVLKRASLFSALTGLRHSDIEKLTWNEVEGNVLNFTQRKTGGVETTPISTQAVALMGDRSQVKPFEGLYYGANKNVILKNWITSARITKKITFHCFRHSYAVLQLSAGTDIFTVSKMLGHRDLKTTQIYAKVVNQAKVDAAQRITLNF